MKIRVLAALLLATAVSAMAQNDYSAGRVSTAADQLKRATLRLAEQTAANLLRGPSHSRGETRDALLAQQIDASATLLVEMIRNRRPGTEVREAAAELTELSRRATGSGWRQVQTAVSDLNRELGGREPSPPSSRPIVGRVTWRGQVDDRVYLVIRGRTIETQTISGAASPDGVSAFTTPLPGIAVDVEVLKQSGRGDVRVLQQPSRANDFTAVIEIYDDRPGSQEYRLEIVWR